MGLAAGGAVSIKALSVPALVIAGLIVLLSNPELRAACATPPSPPGSRWRCTWWPRCRSASPTCGTSRTRTTRTPGGPHSHAGAFRKLVDTLWDRDKLVVVALALAG